MTKQNTPSAKPSNSSAQDSSVPNWYAKLHPIGKDSPQAPKHQKPEKILNLSLFFRIWMAVGVIVIISGIVVFNQLFNYVRPITQQVIEDTLVDTSKLMAANLQSAVETGEIYHSDYQRMLDRAFLAISQDASSDSERKTVGTLSSEDDLAPWYHQKTHSSFRVYVTDATGKVIYDSLQKSDRQASQDPLATSQQPSLLTENNAEGEDYSKWNDVNLTLKGEYGARTTRDNPEDSTTSVMYVAQPIYRTGSQEIIGVVSVGKPTATILPYIDATRHRMLTASFIISIVTLLMAGLIAWWLRQSTLLVTRYTQSLAQDTKKPYFYLGRELNELTDTIETMKHRLENRAYVTDYVHTLTHELKSPLTAIRASGELLEETDLDNDDRLMLSQTITEQSIKLQSLIDRLLLLAKIEQPNFKLSMQPINADDLLKTLIDGSEMQRQHQHVLIDYECQLENPALNTLFADEFWITQALQNILDNALYFSHTKVAVVLQQATIEKMPFIELSIRNDGDIIPEYALSKVFDRYFSLSHQYHTPAHAASSSNPLQKGKKGTGLGLTLVKQVIERHGGTVDIHNIAHEPDMIDSPEIATGVEVTVLLPIIHTISK